jgi:hypothetical protein
LHRCESIKELTRISEDNGKAAQLAAMALLYIGNANLEDMPADNALSLASFLKHYRDETGVCLLDSL